VWGSPLRLIGRALARYLSAPRDQEAHPATSPLGLLEACLQPGDVLLVEGTSRFSTAIKYLTQSTWSHAALYTGEAIRTPAAAAPSTALIEADINEGVRIVPLTHFAGLHTRVCRPVGLTAAEREQVLDFLRARLGYQYDLRNIVDLIRYLVQTPPVPARWRRRMLVLGSGDPTRAICSSLIAQAFQSIRYPILPHTERPPGVAGTRADTGAGEVHRPRHHSFFTPRDFDVSPYFEIIKPRLAAGFDFHELRWAQDRLPASDAAPAGAAQPCPAGAGVPPAGAAQPVSGRR